MDQYPLSSRQQDTSGFVRSPRHVVALALRIKGKLHIDALQGALDEVVARQEALRTRLHYDEHDGMVGFQEVLPPCPVPLTVHDTPLPEGPARDGMAIDVHIALHEAEMSFLTVPSLRAEVYRFDDQDAVLSLVTHHLFSDGWSSDVLRREIAACYRALVTGVPHQLPTPEPYRNFAAWQQEYLASDKGTTDRRFWGGELAGAEMCLLPADRPHGPETQAPHTAVASFAIDPGRFADVVAAAARHRCTVWHVFLAAFMVVAERIAGRTDITLLTIDNARYDEKFYNTVGFFTDFVPIRLDFGDCESFRDLMLLARRASARAQQHRMSFNSILEICPDLMKQAFDPLTLLPAFNYVRSPKAKEESEFTTSVEKVLLPEEMAVSFVRGAFMWVFRVRPSGEARCVVEYEPDAIDAATVRRWGTEFVDLIQTVVDRPDQAWRSRPIP